MFNFNGKSGGLKKFLKENDFQAENIPIHTMLRDLEAEKQAPSDPESKENAEPAQTETHQEPAPGPVAGSSENIKSSPFLSADIIAGLEKKTAAPITARPVFPSGSAESIDKKEIFVKDDEALSQMEEKSLNVLKDIRTKKLLLIVASVFVLVALLIGGYYFWNSRSKVVPAQNAVPEDPVPQENQVSVPENKTPEPPVIASAKFSETERNFFMVDLRDYSASMFKEAVNKYFSEIKTSSLNFPVAFTVIDAGNSTIDFKTFSEKIGLKLSPEILSALENNFILYIFNDQGEPGVGLSIGIKSDTELENTFLKKESFLPGDLESLFPSNQYSLNKKVSFSTSEYDSSRWGKVAIRYYNVASPETLSIDYSFVNMGKEMLLLGTTRNTLHSIIDNSKPSAPSN